MTSVEVVAWIAILACGITYYQMRRAAAALKEANRVSRHNTEVAAAVEKARQDLLEFVELWNYGARAEAADYLKTCGFGVKGTVQ